MVTRPRTAAMVARRYFDYLDAEDWDGMRGLWCADGELRAVGARPRTGVDEVIGYFSRVFAPWPRHRDEPTRLIVDRDVVVAEVRFSGTTRAGCDVAFDAVDVFDVLDGRIRCLSTWYDVAYARQMLAHG